MAERPLEDWEEPDEPYEGDDDPADSFFCPDCGARIYEDAEQCPSCLSYITPRSTSLFSPSGRWMVAAVLLMLGAIGMAVLIFR